MPDSRSGDPGSKAIIADSPGRSTRITLQRIIIVAGTPGVGKTVLAKLLAEKTHSDYLNLGDLVRREKLYSRYDRSSQSYIIDEKRLRSSLDRFFKNHSRRSSVLETHWLGRFMPKRPGMVAVVVRLNPVILARRLKTRSWTRRKIWENVEAELIDLSFYESLKFLGRRRVCQIDGSRRNPSLLVNEVLELIASKRGWDGWSPNWLDRYDPIELSRMIL
jgi:adenylate kinase